MKVRLNDFSRQWSAIEDEATAAFQRAAASGSYILGTEVASFEAELSGAWPVKHTIATGNGLDALEIALRCLDVAPGDPVLTTPLSAFASTLALLRVGAVPVFADVDASGLLDLDLCREVCSRNPRIRTLLVVHLYGHCVDLPALAALRRDFELRVVEDCAQSILARSHGQPAGSVGQVSATSFYPTKNLGAMGDGGAVLTASADHADRARCLRHYGQTAPYVHTEVGLNSRLDEVHAAILRDALLPRLAGWTRKRAATASRYLERIDSRWIQVPTAQPGSESVWHLFPVLVAPGHRSAFARYLNERGVMTGVHYPRLIPEQEAMAPGEFDVATKLTRARRFAEDEVSLPIHPFLTDEETDHVIASVNAWRPD